MTMQLGSQTIVQGQPGFFNAPTTGLKGLIISNESPYTLSVVVGVGLPKTLYPETVDFFPTGPGFNGNVTYTPSGVLTNPTSYTAATIAFDAVGTSENIDVSVYPLALTRPAVNPTASGAPLFTTFFGLGSSTGNNQSLNIFNPANSGVIATFHSAKAFTNSPGVPTANLIYLSGADLNFSGSAGAKSQQGSLTPPVSVMHVTTDDSNNSFGGTALEVGRLPGSVTEGTIDLKTFPDNATLYPGGNMRLSLADTTSGHVIALTLKWSENQQVPPLVVTGAKAVASSIQNDGSPLATQWLEITPSGQGSSAIISTVDGQLTWKVVSGGVYHQALRIQNVANFVQWGQAGDITEFLGQGRIDQLLTAVLGLVVNGATNPTIDISGASGTTGIGLQGGFQLSGKHPAQLAGGTSGTADMYELFTGAMKVVVVLLNNFRTAGAAQSIVFPTAFSNRAMIFARDSEAFQLMLSGVAQTNRQITAFGTAASTAGTTIANTVMTGENWFWLNTGFDTLQFNSGWTAAHGGIYLIIGT